MNKQSHSFSLSCRHGVVVLPTAHLWTRCQARVPLAPKRSRSVITFCMPSPPEGGADTSSSSVTVTATTETSPTAASSVVPAGKPTTAAKPPGSPDSTVANGAGSWQWEESGDAVLAYGGLLALLAAGNLPFLQSAKVADLPYFVGLAVVTIYIGAHRGLTSRQRQQISIKEGILAPVLASVSLFGFYLLIKYLPGLNVKMLLNAYFWLLGSFAISGAAVPVLRSVGGPLGQRSLRFQVPEGLLLDEKGQAITQAEVAPTDIVAVVLAVGLSTAELASGHSNFTLNNLVATLIATDILQLIGARSFRTAGLLLTGLLLYDVFWVFGSPKVVGDNVMLAVATSDLVSGPTRILFPRIPGGGSSMEAAAASFPFSLLGLGDIAIPGLLACLALRYDASRSTDMRARAVAAAEAITSALADLQPGASSRQIADATVNAAEAAYDRIADQENRQRDEMLDSIHSDGAAAAATAAAASFMRGVSSAAAGGVGGSSALGGARSKPNTKPTGSSSSTTGATGAAMPSSSRDCLQSANSVITEQDSEQQQQPRLAVSDAVLYNRKYFDAVLVSYVLGLSAAFVANDITGLGQPALLYIVPATLGAVLLTGAQRGELGRLWAFTDVPSYGVLAAQGKKEQEGER